MALKKHKQDIVALTAIWIPTRRYKNTSGMLKLTKENERDRLGGVQSPDEGGNSKWNKRIKRSSSAMHMSFRDI